MVAAFEKTREKKKFISKTKITPLVDSDRTNQNQSNNNNRRNRGNKSSVAKSSKASIAPAPLPLSSVAEQKRNKKVRFSFMVATIVDIVFVDVYCTTLTPPCVSYSIVL